MCFHIAPLKQEKTWAYAHSLVSNGDHVLLGALESVVALTYSFNMHRFAARRVASTEQGVKYELDIIHFNMGLHLILITLNVFSAHTEYGLWN